jgi:hypothetical protein
VVGAVLELADWQRVSLGGRVRTSFDRIRGEHSPVACAWSKAPLIGRCWRVGVSEYQCYEFVALDRRLTAAEMAELRSISTRAEITPTRFWNEYHWGDLKADPAELLARYFDVHVYFANWGTRRVMFRLPVAAVDLDALRDYLPGWPATLATTGEHAVLDLCSEAEEPEEEWWEEGHLAASLMPLRAELLRGDLRAVYLGWLLAVQDGEVDPDACEPPVPRGLGEPSAPLEALVDFLRIDHDLLAVAAQSADEDADDTDRFREWVWQLPAGEQQRWLLRAAGNLDMALGSALLGEFRRAHPAVGDRPRRTAAQLLARAEELEAARRRQSLRRQAQARADAAAARERQLSALGRRGASAWQEVEQLVEGRSYDEAVRLVVDLREVASRADGLEEFNRVLGELRRRHARRRAFLDRLSRADPRLVGDRTRQ